MPFRAWLLIAALGWLTVDVAFSQEPTPPEQEAQVEPPGNYQGGATAGERPAAQEQDRSPTIFSALNGVEAAIRDLIAEQRNQASQGPASHEVRDLHAQEKMAMWAFWMFVATAATVALTFAALLAILRTLHHTKRAADAAVDMVTEAKATSAAAEATIGVTREIGQAQVRAYLSIKAARAYVDEKDGIVFDVTVENSGQSPAKGVHAVVGVWVNRKVTLSADMGGEMGTMSVEVFSRSVEIGDIASGEARSSRLCQTHDLSFPADVVRTEERVIRAGAGNVGVFATDVFNKELFEIGGTLVATGPKQFAEWDGHGNFSHKLPYFGDSHAMRSRGWKAYEAQNHQFP